METPKDQRRRLFKTALAATGLTQIQWGKEHGIGYANLSCILSGTRKSRRVISEIDCFIDQTIRSLKVQHEKAA